VKVVITGAAGFLGSHLCDRFLRDGHQVIGVDNYLTGSPDNIRHLADNDAFRLIEADVSVGIPLDEPIDGILHFASPASPIDYYEFPIETLRVGSYGTHNCLELARRRNARFFLASTSEVYGDPAVHPQPESYWGNVNSIGPRSVYDEAKRYGEAVTMAYHRHHGVDTRIVRIFNTYGPRMRPHDGRVVSNFIVQALLNQSITIYGDGTQTRSFCYVDDLVRGLELLMGTGDEVTGPINLGNPEEFQVRALAETIIGLSNSRSELVFKPLPSDDPKQRQPDISRARALGFEVTVGLRDGLSRTIEYFDRLLRERDAS